MFTDEVVRRASPDLCVSTDRKEGTKMAQCDFMYQNRIFLAWLVFDRRLPPGSAGHQMVRRPMRRLWEFPRRLPLAGSAPRIYKALCQGIPV